MRINSIQPKLMKTNYVKNNQKNDGAVSNPQSVNPQFRGEGDGTLIGVTGGVLVSMTALGAAAIAGVFMAPALIATAVIGGSAVAGGAIGTKIEEKINENKKK